MAKNEVSSFQFSVAGNKIGKHGQNGRNLKQNPDIRMSRAGRKANIYRCGLRIDAKGKGLTTG
jgi:hypothetical protein